MFVLCIISACFSSLRSLFIFISIFIHINDGRGDKANRIFYDAFSFIFFHALYEIFVLCIIYCMPQNSGRQMRIDWKYCENWKDLWRTRNSGIVAENLWRKNCTINQRASLFLASNRRPFFPQTRFASFRFYFSGEDEKKKSAGNEIYEHASGAKLKGKKYCISR